MSERITREQYEAFLAMLREGRTGTNQDISEVRLGGVCDDLGAIRVVPSNEGGAA